MRRRGHGGLGFDNCQRSFFSWAQSEPVKGWSVGEEQGAVEWLVVRLQNRGKSGRGRGQTWVEEGRETEGRRGCNDADE